MLKLKVCLMFCYLFCVVGCATGTSSISDLSLSITELQRVVQNALPLGLRKQSQNSREFFSNYFVVVKGEYQDAISTSKRNTAHIVILGDRRPYTIEVTVITEKRSSSGDFVSDGFDEGLARVITRRIQKALHERRDNRNIIDDFRVF